MKNKVNYILFGILVSFLFASDVFALDTFDYSMDITTDSTEVVVGSDVSVYISLKSEAMIDSCIFGIDYDDNIEFVDVINLNGWIVDVPTNTENTDRIFPLDRDYENNIGNLSNGLNVMLLKYRVNGNGSIKVSSSSYCSNGDVDVNVNEKKIDFKIKELSNDYTLKSIKINGKAYPDFNPNGVNYLIKLEEPNFSLEYETTNSDYQDDVVVRFNGNVVTDLNNIVWSDPTNQGAGILEIIVNNQKNYLFSVNYEVLDLDNTLKSLKIGGNIVELQNSKTNYTVKVSKNDIIIEIEAVLNDPINFKLDETFENGKLLYNCSGDNYCLLNIEVFPVDQSSGGKTLLYTIEIIKEGDKDVSPESTGGSSSSSKPTIGDVEKNPETGDISMFFMALILISSLVGSVFLYQKNMEGYK